MARIAVCSRRTDTAYRNQELPWGSLAERCRNPKRTPETAEEYAGLPRPRRDEAKDQGGFVGGWLKEGRRKRGNVLFRCLGTLDADSIPEGSGFLGKAQEALAGHAWLIYSTHSHRPGRERYRIVFPLSRDVSEEEYPAAMRKFAQRIGMDFFDDTTYEAHRMMFWPSCPSDGEFVFRSGDGKAVDPDEWLGMYGDWRDVSQWPASTRESEPAMRRSAEKQADPLSKGGIVGAFCRAYSIEDAIARFLPGVYGPSAVPGRYDYIPGEGSAGVVIYDGRFAYSHHATDPACSRLLNAFDLVRMHRFGAEDEKESFAGMARLAADDDAVKKELARSRARTASEDFREDADWTSGLQYTRKGELADSSENLALILANDPGLRGFAFNEMAGRVEVTQGVPWGRPDWNAFWRDADTAQLKAFLDRSYLAFSTRNHDVAFAQVTDDRRFHPVRGYIEGLRWDGRKRMDTLLIDFLGADDSPYTRAVTRKTLAAGVARIMEPGVKFDHVPVLCGPQGCGKSTLCARLGGSYYSDSLTITDMKDKTGAEKLQGYWVLELSELTGMRKADMETVKSFITRTDDKYRESYGRTVQSHPRQCVIIGTTNSEDGFLRDITGNRRFWPVRVTGNSPRKAWELDPEGIGQIWAEAAEAWKSGEKLYLEGDEAIMASERQSEAMETDEREGLVRDYLETLLPVQWPAMSLGERRDFLCGNDFHDRRGSAGRTAVCNMEIWAECLGKDPAAMRKADSYELAAIMQRMDGWNKYTGNRNGSIRFPLYGKQRAYSRDAEQAGGLILVPPAVPKNVPGENDEIPF